MRELNFCPYCGIQSHKLMYVHGNTFFCKGCEGFFSADQPSLSCPKCSSVHIRKSDYVSLDGKGVFLCQRCLTHVGAHELIPKTVLGRN